MVRLGDIAEIHRDGKEFAPVREWAPGTGLVPGYGYARRCWSREPVFTSAECVLITVNTPIYNTIGAVHYRAWVVEGACAYTRDIWRISFKPNVQRRFINMSDIARQLNKEMGYFYDIGAPADESDDEEDPVESLLDYDLELYSVSAFCEYKHECKYAREYLYEAAIDITLPLGLPGLTLHYDFGDDKLTRVTFPYAGAKITIHRGYVVAKFSPWDIIITDGVHLTKWDLTVDHISQIGAILCEYGLGQPHDDIGETFLTWAWREYMDARDAEVKKLLPGPIFEEVGEHLEVEWKN